MKKLIIALPLLFIYTSCNNQGPAKGFYRGVDYQGDTKDCKLMEAKMCTEIFTQEDQFSVDCQDKGHKAIQCDCHDWICVKK